MASSEAEVTSAHPAYTRWRMNRSAIAGELNEYWINILEEDLSLRDVVFCVELVFGKDKIVRIANKSCSVVSGRTGEVVSYLPVLQDTPDFVQAYSFGDATSEARSLTFKLPSSLVNVRELIRDGRTLAGVAEITLQVDGGDYDQRCVLMRGDMADGVSFASIDELIELTVQDPKTTVDVYAPPFVIDSDTFSTNEAETTIGQRYAVVLPKYSGIPAPFISTSVFQAKVLVGYGRLTDIANRVIIDGDSFSRTHATYGYTFAYELDNDGNSVTTVTFGTTASGTFEFSEQIYFSASSSFESASPIDQVHEIANRFTALGLIGLSPELFAAAQAKMGGMKSRMLLNAGGAATATAISYIEGEFLASFPMVSMLFHGSGYGPIVVDRRSDISVMRLDADQWPILDRASYVTETPKDDCSNEFVLSYAYDPVEDVYTKIVTRGVSDSLLCSISQQQIGHRPHEVIESRYIHDENTARAVVDWMVDHLTLPSYLVEYAVDASLVMRVKPGDNIRLTDPEFGWSEIAATIESIVYKRSHSVLLLRVWWRYYTLGTGALNAQGGFASGGQG